MQSTQNTFDLIRNRKLVRKPSNRSRYLLRVKMMEEIPNEDLLLEEADDLSGAESGSGKSPEHELIDSFFPRVGDRPTTFA